MVIVHRYIDKPRSYLFRILHFLRRSSTCPGGQYQCLSHALFCSFLILSGRVAQSSYDIRSFRLKRNHHKLFQVILSSHHAAHQNHVVWSRGNRFSPSTYGSPACSLAISLIHRRFGLIFSSLLIAVARYSQLTALPTVLTSSLTDLAA